MRVVTCAVIGLLALSGAVLAQDSGSPHHMTTADGKVDTDKCYLCHEEDLHTLSRSKVETCTLCHSTTPHSGAAEHLRAAPASVARALDGKQGNPTMPLTEDGHIYCGTCHIFHDPQVTHEAALATGWVPPSTGLPEAVRSSLTAQWERVASKYAGTEGPVAKFAAVGTRNLRLPVNDGTLCRHCHGSDR